MTDWYLLKASKAVNVCAPVPLTTDIPFRLTLPLLLFGAPLLNAVKGFAGSILNLRNLRERGEDGVGFEVGQITLSF